MYGFICFLVSTHLMQWDACSKRVGILSRRQYLQVQNGLAQVGVSYIAVE